MTTELNRFDAVFTVRPNRWNFLDVDMPPLQQPVVVQGNDSLSSTPNAESAYHLQAVNASQRASDGTMERAIETASPPSPYPMDIRHGKMDRAIEGLVDEFSLSARVAWLEFKDKTNRTVDFLARLFLDENGVPRGVNPKLVRPIAVATGVAGVLTAVEGITEAFSDTPPAIVEAAGENNKPQQQENCPVIGTGQIRQWITDNTTSGAATLISKNPNGPDLYVNRASASNAQMLPVMGETDGIPGSTSQKITLADGTEINVDGLLVTGVSEYDVMRFIDRIESEKGRPPTLSEVEEFLRSGNSGLGDSPRKSVFVSNSEVCQLPAGGNPQSGQPEAVRQPVVAIVSGERLIDDGTVWPTLNIGGDVFTNVAISSTSLVVPGHEDLGTLKGYPVDTGHGIFWRALLPDGTTVQAVLDKKAGKPDWVFPEIKPGMAVKLTKTLAVSTTLVTTATEGKAEEISGQSSSGQAPTTETKSPKEINPVAIAIPIAGVVAVGGLILAATSGPKYGNTQYKENRPARRPRPQTHTEKTTAAVAHLPSRHPERTAHAQTPASTRTVPARIIGHPAQTTPPHPPTTATAQTDYGTYAAKLRENVVSRIVGESRPDLPGSVGERLRNDLLSRLPPPE